MVGYVCVGERESEWVSVSVSVSVSVCEWV